MLHIIVLQYQSNTLNKVEFKYLKFLSLAFALSMWILHPAILFGNLISLSETYHCLEMVGCSLQHHWEQ